VNKIERMNAALRGEPVDRVPASFWFHFPPGHAAGHAMAKAHLDYYRAADPDFLKVMNDNSYAPGGVEAVETIDDWRRLKPAPLTSQPFQNQLAGLREVVDAVGDEVLVITTIFSPYTNGDRICGRKLREHLSADAESVSVGLATIAEALAEFAQACIEAGAAGIFFSTQGDEEDRFTAAQFREYIKPHDVAVLGAAEDAGATFNLLHICGKHSRLEAYADYPAHAVNWAPQLENVSLSEGRRLLRRTIVGGVDQRGVVVDGSKEQIEAEVRIAIAEMGTQGFMIGAGCTVPSDVRIENLLWARAASSRPR
jgi:uroporphyrinogen decarboxylase